MSTRRSESVSINSPVRQVAEGREQSDPDGCRMTPQLVNFFNGYSAAIALYDGWRKTIE
jgi:hypothetical protein